MHKLLFRRILLFLKELSFVIMKLILVLTFLFVFLNCTNFIESVSKSKSKSGSKSRSKSKGKKGKKGKSRTPLGGDFLGDITPPPNEVYNLHVDLSKTNDLNQFSVSDIEKINDTLTLLYEEHDQDVKYFQQIMNARQKIIDELITEVKKLKLNRVLV